MLMQEFEGKSKEEAIQNALEILNLAEEEVKIEIVEDKNKASFFGFGRKLLGKPVKIKVYYEEKESEISNTARKFLEQLFTKINIELNTTLIREDKDTILIHMDSPASGLIIGRKGKTLEALQFLSNVIANKGHDPGRKIILDIESYRSKKEEAIKKLALRTADEVRKTRNSKLLDPMNPFERRLVHLTLQNFKDLETKSEGDGIYKKVRVFLKNSPPPQVKNSSDEEE